MSARSTTRRIVPQAAVFTGLFALLLLAYAAAHFTFLRAESGAFQVYVAQGWQASLATIHRDWIQHSNNGHFTPVAIALEFACTWLFGTAEWPWRIRQLAILALLSTILWSLLWRVSAAVERPWLRVAVPVVVALYALQPPMVDFVTWPLTSMHMVSLSLGLLALGHLALADVADAAAMRRSVWWAAGLSYASLHFLGNGIVFIGATALALLLIARLARPRGIIDATVRRSALRALATLAIVTAIHGALMANTPATVQGSVDLLDLTAMTGGLIAFMAERFFGFWIDPAAHFTLPAADRLRNAAWLGGAIVAGIIGLVGYWLREALRQPSRRALALSILGLFGAMGFLGQAALVAYRLRHQAAADLFPLYVVGSRYIALYSLFLLVWLFAVMATLPPLATARKRWAVIAATLLVVASLAQFAFTQAVHVPRHVGFQRYDQAAAWAATKAAVAELAQAGRPLPDLDVTWLIEVPARLHHLEALLRKEIEGLGPSRFEWIDPASVPVDEWSALRRRFPAFDRLLGLQERL